MENKTTDEQMFSMKLKTFVPMLFAIIVGTNTVSLTLQRLSNLEQKSTYDVNANKRRIEHSIKELEYKIKLEKLEEDLSKFK
jgi:hypothetical protein